jgi:hypothetical protein
MLYSTATRISNFDRRLSIQQTVTSSKKYLWSGIQLNKVDQQVKNLHVIFLLQNQHLLLLKGNHC